MNSKVPVWQCGRFRLEFDVPAIMAIINVTPDSFSGDGTLDFGAAVEMARSQVRAGADIIDVGAESARTNRAARVTVGTQLRTKAGIG